MNPTTLVWTPGTQYQVGDMIYDNNEILVKTGVLPDQSDDWEVINPQGTQDTFDANQNYYTDTYEKMSDLLKDKGLPNMDTLLKIAKENNPELFI